jgi:hypothetical protein
MEFVFQESAAELFLHEAFALSCLLQHLCIHDKCLDIVTHGLDVDVLVN